LSSAAGKSSKLSLAPRADRSSITPMIGRFIGKQEVFVNGTGRRQPVSGTWDLAKLAKDQFKLELKFDNGTQWSGTFRILDRDHIHNLGENYVAVRVVR
jgi:hypothetical protein